jgi:hypothetical protein
MVFIMMLIAGIFRGYDNQALAHTATAFSKELEMTPAALAPAFTAGLFGMGRRFAVWTTEDRIGRRPAFMASLYLGCVHPHRSQRPYCVIRAPNRRNSCGHPIVHL